jgi:hypothetical protein
VCTASPSESHVALTLTLPINLASDPEAGWGIQKPAYRHSCTHELQGLGLLGKGVGGDCLPQPVAQVETQRTGRCKWLQVVNHLREVRLLSFGVSCPIDGDKGS